MKSNRIILFVALCVGIYTALFLLQRSAWFNNALRNKLVEIVEHNLDCTASIELSAVDLINHRVYIKQLTADSNNAGDWAFAMSDMTIDFSWLTLLMRRRFALSVRVPAARSMSLVRDGEILIREPLFKLLFADSEMLPIDIHHMSIERGSMDLYSPHHSIHTHINWSSTTHRAALGATTTLTVYNTSVDYKQKNLITDLHGPLQIYMARDGRLDARMSVQWLAPAFGDENFLLSGSCTRDSGDWRLVADKNSIRCDTVHADFVNNSFQVSGSLIPQNIKAILPASIAQVLRGNCCFDISGTVRDTKPSVTGTITANKLGIKSVPLLDRAIVQFSYSDQQADGTLQLSRHRETLFNGSWNWDGILHTGSVTGTNPDTISLDEYWTLPEHQLSINGSINHKGLFLLHNATCSHRKTHAHGSTNGSIEVSGSHLDLTGGFNNYRYDIDMDFGPFSLNKASITKIEPNGNCHILSQAHIRDKKMNLSIDYALLHKFLPQLIRPELAGHGTVTLTTEPEGNHIIGKLELKDGSILLGHTNNMITGLSGVALYDGNNKTITIPTIALQLYRGAITLHDGVVKMGSGPFSIASYTLPCAIEDCFIGWQDMSAIVDGNIMIDQENSQAPVISGMVTIDKGCINYNVLSSEFSKSARSLPSGSFPFLAPDIRLDCKLKSSQPIKVHTGVLNSDITVDLGIGGTITTPDITGTISLLHGMLHFPCAALRITHGAVHFISGQPYDPLIEVTARGMVKRYSITLGVNGTATDPAIRLESMPTLAEEQIGSLLLAGTEDASLNVVVPAILAQNLKTIIFGAEQRSKAVYKKWYHRLLKPLRHIRLVPTFTDQTGRDGFKAAIEVNVNDRLNARIEKNFSSTEDVAWEVDYRMTDDLSTKIIRDEHGDLGGEAEMSWKF